MIVNKNNKLNLIINNMLCNKKLFKLDNLNMDNLKNLTHISSSDKINIHNNFNYYYNFLVYGKLSNLRKVRAKFKFNREDKLKKTILNVNRTSLTLKSNRVYRFKLISCIGSGDGWIGIGEGRNKLFKKSYVKSTNLAKRYIYNLNFKCNDYKQLKYKGCKFKAINMLENKNNFNIYNNISKISGNKKIKLISYSSKTPINIIKSIVHLF